MAAKHDRAIDYIANHPWAYTLRSLRHGIFMWTGFWSFNQDYLRQEPFDPENICFLTLLSLLSIAGLYFMFREGRGVTARLYFLVLLSFPVPYYLSHLDPGFRHPVDPLLVILACFALTQVPGPNARAGSHQRTDCRTRIALAEIARKHPGVLLSKTNAILSIFLFALVATASGQKRAQ